MAKSYDSAYFHRWYRDPRTRVTSERALERKVHLALSAAEYMLGRRVRTVLDVGCGEGRWFVALRRVRPGVLYTGVESSEYAVETFGASRNIRRGSFGTLRTLKLRGLLGGVAYIEAYAREDDMVGDMEGWNYRSAATYRRAFKAAGLTHCGLYCFIDADKIGAVNALEACS